MLYRRLRLVLRIFLIMLLVLSVLAGTALFVLHRNPEALLSSYRDDIAYVTGLHITAQGVHVALLPLPALVASAPTVEGHGWTFAADSVSLVPDYLALLDGKLIPRRLVLQRPRLAGSLSPQASGVQPPKHLFRPDPAALRELIRLGIAESARLGVEGPVQLVVDQGEADIAHPEGARLRITGLRCDLRLKPPERLRGRLSWRQASFSAPGQPDARLDSLLLFGKTENNGFLDRSPALHAQGTLLLSNWLARMDFSLDLNTTDTGWGMTSALRGDVRKNDVLLPFQLAGDISGQKTNHAIGLQNLQLVLGRDSAILNGTLEPGGTETFALHGRLELRRASLTQWLGFARSLAPGLQVALDDVTEGILTFVMDGKGLHVPHIEVSAAGSRFAGSGGVASWANPEVALDLASDSVDLGKALPESVAMRVKEPSYGHEPLTPRPGSPVLPDDPGVGYDIRLKAARVNYGPLLIDNAQVIIKPGLIDPVSRLEDTLLLAEGSLYGGSIKGETILGGAAETPYAIRLSLRNVDGTHLAQALPVIPVSGGSLRGDVNIQSQGKEIDVFLDKLRGTVAVRAQGGTIRPLRATEKKSSSIPFKTLDIGLKVRTAAWEQGRLGLEGQWTGSLTRDNMQLSTDLNGRLWFGGEADGANMEFRGIPGSCTLTLPPGHAPDSDGAQAQITGKFGFQAARDLVSVSEARVAAFGVEGSGSAQISLDAERPSWQGKFSAVSPDLAQTLRQVGMPAARPPQPLRRMELEGAFKGTPSTLEISGLRLRVDKNDIKGSVQVDWRQTPNLKYSLAAEKLNLDRYLEDNTPKKTAKAAEKPWDLRFLRTFNAQGEVRVGQLTAMKLAVHDLRLSSRLENGHLRYETLSARFYRAPLTVRGSMTFGQGLTVENSLYADGVDLKAASADRGGDAVLTGRGSLSAEIRAQMTGPGQFPARANGKWRISLTKGSYQTRDKAGNLKGKPTHFEAAGSSGSLINGVARSSDFYLKAQDMKLDGGGWVDLDKRTLDCTLTVNKTNLPEFPLRLYGSLDKPQTSIGAGKFLLNTLGGITQGVFDVFGGLVQGAWKIFR
ncbi:MULTISPECIES: AsmA-like C-terminal region-containing protein [unclassified Desulfovibrio]|uniref:AsmA family protein n=1 Tax=unclassified Desulfovibrio TaxID=2593640 RepID=UPI000F601E14|nr:MULTISPECIES: AsmA-like C-terminal region-containing protein [unclassified Desulfovibrio]RRD69534.1 AsmA family protein [Desulfovibrio sp. OH1209_COT-279]RRD86208.1 AsmA family protein [Desulfovibrio sp. OH1186_COT-070]